ncbi:hypothetical protein GCM10010990_16000 [Croceicoccus mobilis]|uniref:Uncharacterized protein n=1 Tax=Croceicoccus mobilis TaxID=1703339 RepID=A0A917DTH1_9SPHN|nr:hypothetical protein GCM10010990_16000 [Croceicoccus mobilis]
MLKQLERGFAAGRDQRGHSFRFQRVNDEAQGIRLVVDDKDPVPLGGFIEA